MHVCLCVCMHVPNSRFFGSSPLLFFLISSSLLCGCLMGLLEKLINVIICILNPVHILPLNNKSDKSIQTIKSPHHNQTPTHLTYPRVHTHRNEKYASIHDYSTETSLVLCVCACVCVCCIYMYYTQSKYVHYIYSKHIYITFMYSVYKYAYICDRLWQKQAVGLKNSFVHFSLELINNNF